MPGLLTVVLLHPLEAAPVNIPDANLKIAIEVALGVTNPEPSDMLSLTYLGASVKNIADLTGLEYATNLTELDLSGNQISNLSTLTGLTNLTILILYNNQISDILPLAGLTNLSFLYLCNNQLSDLSPLSGMTNLETLRLDSNQISNSSPLAGLTNLELLDLSYNQISDVSLLTGLTNLTSLSLSGNQISDVSLLAGMTNMTYLSLYDNQISDISSLASLTNLTYLSLSSNQISDTSSLTGLKNLTQLYLNNNQISDVSPMTGLTNLRNLKLGQNQISDLSPLSSLTNLTNLELFYNQISDTSSLLGLTSLTNLNLANNSISSISSLAGLVNLTVLDLSVNQISDISPLEGMTNLTNLYLYYNQINDISSLAGMTNLIRLYLHNNQISDVSPLTGMTNLTNLDLTNNPLNQDAYSDLLQIEASNPGIDLKSDLGPQDTNEITISKMTIKAGKTRAAEADSFLVTGTFDAAAEDFTAADSVYVSVGFYDETIDCDDFKQAGKKPKYIYKGAGSITSLTLDINKGTFIIIAKNIDLTGLSNPVEVWLIFGEYVGMEEAAEDVINAKKYLPMQLQSGYADDLRVEKVVCKPGKENNVKNLVISGSIATADDIDLRVASLLLHWGASDHAVGLGEFELKGKTKYQYKKSPNDVDPANIVISIDLVKCTFKIIAKNTKWPWQTGPVAFALEFGTFHETEEVAF